MNKIFDNLHELSNLTPLDIKLDNWSYVDAGEELNAMAEYIQKYSMHHENIDIDRVKFIYTKKHKKIAGRFILGDVVLRTEMEKIVNNEFDYIICIDYLAWKELDLKNKIMQLDKLLCGIDGSDEESPKKKATDSREHVDNMKFFGPSEVLNSSESVHMCIGRLVEEERQKKKEEKEKQKEKLNYGVE